MHTTIILSEYLSDLCFNHDQTMLICRHVCEQLARRKSPNYQYVATFSDEYSPGYKRVPIANNTVHLKCGDYYLTFRQYKWISALGLKTLNNMVGHFYIKITPFEC